MPERRGEVDAERRRRLLHGSDKLADDIRPCITSTPLSSRRQPTSLGRAETPHSADSWSSESIDIDMDNGSDTTDFTLCEFVDHHPRRRIQRRSSSGSSGTLPAESGPHVTRIAVSPPTRSPASPVRTRKASCHRTDDSSKTPLVRNCHSTAHSNGNYQVSSNIRKQRRTVALGLHRSGTLQYASIKTSDLFCLWFQKSAQPSTVSTVNCHRNVCPNSH